MQRFFWRARSQITVTLHESECVFTHHALKKGELKTLTLSFVQIKELSDNVNAYNPLLKFLGNAKADLTIVAFPGAYTSSLLSGISVPKRDIALALPHLLKKAQISLPDGALFTFQSTSNREARVYIGGKSLNDFLSAIMPILPRGARIAKLIPIDCLSELFPDRFFYAIDKKGSATFRLPTKTDPATSHFYRFCKIPGFGLDPEQDATLSQVEIEKTKTNIGRHFPNITIKDELSLRDHNDVVKLFTQTSSVDIGKLPSLLPPPAPFNPLKKITSNHLLVLSGLCFGVAYAGHYIKSQEIIALDKARGELTLEIRKLAQTSLRNQSSSEQSSLPLLQSIKLEKEKILKRLDSQSMTMMTESILINLASNPPKSLSVYKMVLTQNELVLTGKVRHSEILVKWAENLISNAETKGVDLTVKGVSMNPDDNALAFSFTFIVEAKK